MIHKPLIIFDFDGTLVDCKALHQTGFRQAVLSQMPTAQFTDVEVEGMPTTEKIDYLCSKGIMITDEINQIKQQHTIDNIHDYIMYNIELKAELHTLSRHYNISLATNGRHDFIQRALGILDIWTWDSLYTPDHGPAKPDTWMFDQCMIDTGNTPETTIIFEDSPMGIACAKETGATVIEVTDAADTLNKIKELNSQLIRVH